MQEAEERIYGINPVFEAVSAGRREIYRVWLNREGTTNPRLKKLASFLSSRGVKIEWADKAALFDLCGTREHQGAVLDSGPFPYTPYADLLGESRLVLLDSIEDPHNVGAIMRSAEVFGWRNVLLPRRGAPLVIPSVAKSSAGACEHLRIACNCSPNQYVKIALDEGYSVVSLDGGGKVSLESVKAAGDGRILLVVGGENSGVSQFILNSSNYIAAIPQSGHVNSLNASVAAGVALYVLRA
ncbi:MAG: RNA methyltransferase [Victivallales bacterium]|nr:RNA methyltransferase [Victivallales bacterium]